ncbi:hypothetical protein HDU76_001077 [Blyttiomyces sp. JEL0837]|nr:hypothetical protein HDU76_001077 [Blyttiomyces sp. JEL0837]
MFEKENAIMEYVLKTATRGDPASVLKAMDDFGYNQQWHMSVGDVKAEICKKAIKEADPKLMVELGLYVGYSAICFASLLSPGSKYISFEVNPEFAKIASTLIEFAGLADRHSVILGPFHEKWEELQGKKVDLFFIDHIKSRYLEDFKIMEKSGICRSGTVIVADNVIRPGAPDYLEYVIAGGLDGSRVKSHELIESELEYSNGTLKDGISIAVMA